MGKKKKVGRKKIAGGAEMSPRKMVVLTVPQARFVERYSKKNKVSQSEALRQIIESARLWATKPLKKEKPKSL